MTRIAGIAAAFVLAAGSWGQPSADQPDAQSTKDELTRILDRYPPALRDAIGADPTLLGNQPYLAPYPALTAFLNRHPDVARDPRFYLERYQRQPVPDARSGVIGVWRDVLQGVAVFSAFGMIAGMIIWLTRTLIDARRWNRVAKVQTDVHMKLLDRFANNEDLLAYVQSPAGSRFLQSAPITLDAPQRSMGAPLSRILWSMQGGVVLLAGGIGMLFVGARASMAEAAEPLRGVGIVAIALGLGFVASAAMSYLLSHRLGLIDTPSRNAAQTLP